MILRRVSRILGLAVILAAVAEAQELPSHERGLAADTVYQGGDISFVNEFNRNLVITLHHARRQPAPLPRPAPSGAPGRRRSALVHLVSPRRRRGVSGRGAVSLPGDLRGLERVCEAQESAWAGTCTGIETRDTYDESGNLIHVCSGASATGCSQERFFTYDNRGLLTGERHPEIGPTGNGWTYYSYDALGNALSRILAGTSDFSLLYTYARASRLIRIDEVTGPGESRPLKEFYFARSNAGSDLRKGKLVRAKRHNWVDVVAPLRVSGTLDAVITDLRGARPGTERQGGPADLGLSGGGHARGGGPRFVRGGGQ